MSEGHDESNDYRVERKGSVWVFTINRAEQRNSLTWPIRFALLRTVGEAEADPDCGALIVTGAGDKAVCSGGDLRAKALASADQWPRDPMGRLRSIGEIVRCISTSPIVVISAVNGAALAADVFSPWPRTSWSLTNVRASALAFRNEVSFQTGPDSLSCLGSSGWLGQRI